MAAKLRQLQPRLEARLQEQEAQLVALIEARVGDGLVEVVEEHAS